MIPRLIELSDYDNGYIKLLSQLTVVGNITKNDFERQIKNIMSNSNHLIYVIPDSKTNEIIASGTLLIEPKIIHEMSNVGHIEDIVVNENYRGYGLGKIMINHLTEKAKEKKCYKVILDCSEENVKFYEKCGFKSKEIEMVKYFK